VIRVAVGILVVALVGTLIIGVAAAVVGRVRMARTRRRVHDVLGSVRARRLDDVELVELRSRGRGGGAGRGGLALTSSHLVFVPHLAGAPVLRIPLDGVVTVEVPRRHRRAIGWDRMLRITFHDPAPGPGRGAADAPVAGGGGEDQAVWRLDDAAGWARALAG
jgi:hypothetical protein